MDQIALIVAVGGFLLEALALLVGGVWVVSKIQSTTDNLSEALDDLSATLKDIDKLQREHADRITRLEATK